MNKYKKILVLGAGPVKIGQSLEFDYSALQVCHALKDEGIEVVFINSTPSALSTDKAFADKVYIEPLNIDSVKRVLEKERPDALIASASGDNGLELSLELEQNGYLEETGTELLGVSADIIRSIKNRHAFVNALSEMDEPTVDALVVNSVEEACDFADKAGYPVIVRPAYTPDRESAEFCYTPERLREKAEDSLKSSIVSQILIEKCIAGWKEIEFEVIRDSEDNTVCISTAEGVDPVGIHTGDSIIVIPAQTLAEYAADRLQSAAFKIVSRMGIEGSCNVQFALSPDGAQYVVTGVDPRVNRTSALISKAMGYRIAYISAKIALGKSLNDIEGVKDIAALGYCAVKFPKWSFESFDSSDRRLGTVMQATGECLAIGANFETAFMKAVRSVNESSLPHLSQLENISDDELISVIKNADDRRIFGVYEALCRGFAVEELNSITKIDKWFLSKLKGIADTEKRLAADGDDAAYENAIKTGFTHRAVEELCGKSFEREMRVGFNGIGSDSADTANACFYSDYGAPCADMKKSDKKRVLVVGSGPAVAGRSGDSDYCTVHAVNALKALGYEVIMLNNNPASVTTDYTVADRLYLEPLTEEDILNVVRAEKPDCTLLMFGGEDAVKKSEFIKNEGVEILGADYELYRKITNKIELFDILDDANIKHAGSRKTVVGTCIEAYIISDGEQYFVPAVCEHIEKTHINSGDSISVLPTVSLSEAMRARLEEYVASLIAEMPFKGMLDLQLVVFDNDLYVTKAAVTDIALVPFAAKASGEDITALAVRCMAGERLTETGFKNNSDKFFVRVPVFSFEQLSGADILPGEKAKFTGDVMGIGDTFENALLKGLIASGVHIKRTGAVLVSVSDSDKSDTVKMSQEFLAQGFKIYASSDIAKKLNSNHVAASSSGDDAVQMINENKFSYIVSTLSNDGKNGDNIMLRRAALMKNIPVFTSVQGAYAFAKALADNNVMENAEVTDI